MGDAGLRVGHDLGLAGVDRAVARRGDHTHVDAGNRLGRLVNTGFVGLRQLPDDLNLIWLGRLRYCYRESKVAGS